MIARTLLLPISLHIEGIAIAGLLQLWSHYCIPVSSSEITTEACYICVCFGYFAFNY